MQAKDTNRLSVLRSLLTQTLNASKTSTPINTDLQMLALLRKSANASRLASAEFESAGRQDLAEKEESQLRIMEEYADGVETVGDEDIMVAVKRVVDRMKDEGATMQMGEVMKRVLAPEILGEKPVARGDVAKIVKQVLIES
jgi:uncharacterized protein YqeY